MTRIPRQFRIVCLPRAGGKRLAAFAFLVLAALPLARAVPPVPGTAITNTATSTQTVGAQTQTANSNPVTVVVGPASTAPTLTKAFGAALINSGSSTTLTFTLTNSAGNPAQTGIAFVDTLPSGLRLTSGAMATVTGAGCTASVGLTAPSTVSVSSLSMALGSASCLVTVNGVTNVAGGNPDCTTNPVAFTNGPASISGLVGLFNGVTNQCLVVAAQNGVLTASQAVTVMPGTSYTFPHTLTNGPLADSYSLTTTNLAGTYNFSNIQIFVDANNDGIADNAIPVSGPINLIPNQIYRFVVVASIPAGALPATFDELRVTATSLLPGRLPIPPVLDRAEVVAPPAPPNADLSVLKSITANVGPSPSGPYTIRIRYGNLNGPLGEKTNVVISDSLPAGMTFVPGTLRVTPTLPGTAVSLPGVNGMTMVGGVPATYTTAPSNVSVTLARLAPNAFGLVEFDVNIDAGLATNTVLRNIATSSYTDSMGVDVPPKPSNPVDFLISGSERITLTGMTIPSAPPGSTVSFNNVLTNNTGRSDTFDVTLGASNYPAGTIIRLFKADGVTPLSDSNGNSVADTGPVANGAAYTIVVRAELPNGAAGGPYSVAKTARSVTNGQVSATATDTVSTISSLCRVTLEPNNVGRIQPGGSIVYNHVLTNVGNCVERITFPDLANTTVQSAAASLPSTDRINLAAAVRDNQSGWTSIAFVDGNAASSGGSTPGVVDAFDTRIDLATAFDLQPGEFRRLLVRVASPASAMVGMTNRTDLRVNASQTGTLGNEDLTTIVAAGTPVVVDEITPYIDPIFNRPTVWAFIGRPLYLRASAPSCNAQPTVIETRTIIITGPNGEREEIVATETGPDTGIFTADGLMVRLPPVVPVDNVLEGRPYDTYQIELVGCGKKISTSVTLIDPSGVVFDSRTNTPVSGAIVRIVTASGGMCTSTTAQVSDLVMGQIVPAPSTFTTGLDGRYTFPLVAPGDYCLIVTAPNGYTWISTVPVSQLPAGRNILATGPTSGGSYGGSFRVGPETGPVLVDIPVDGGLIGGLFLQKASSRPVVEMGETLDYTITVNNRTGYALDQSDVMLTDNLPPGFTYVAGSARREGAPLADPIGGAGPRLVFNLGRMTRDQKLVITYRVRVGPGAQQGDGVNRAVASYRVNAATTLFSESNVATAKVQIAGGVFSDKAFIIGKVFADCNGDALQELADGSKQDTEHGVPGVRVVLEDGTSAISDSEGKFSFYGLSARTHVLKIDRTTLPEGIEIANLSHFGNRNAGKSDSRFIDLKFGELHKANFALKACSATAKKAIGERRTAAASLAREIDGRLQQRFEADPNLRPVTDVKALPASGLVGNAAPVANVSTTAPLGASLDAVGATVKAATGVFDTIAQPVSAPLQRVPHAAPPVKHREPEIVLENLLPELDNKIGFVGLKDGDVLATTQTTVRVKGVAGATFKLSLNGKLIGEDRVGKRAVFMDKSSQAWEYVGVDFQVGVNTLKLTQVDQFGNARGDVEISVKAPGALGRLVLTPQYGARGEAIADGKSQVQIQVLLTDRDGVPVTARTAITLESSLGRWDVDDLNTGEAGVQTFVEGGRATFALYAPGEPGTAQVRVASGDIGGESRVDFLPDLRDLMASGVIEGILSLRRLDVRGISAVRPTDAFEQEIEHLSRSWKEGERTAGVRAAMFLRGRVKGEYLLTLAYDSEKNTRERLFRDIQPDEFYPVYGDSSVRAFDAQSTGRFYVRVDKRKSYLLYGDYNTSQASEVRKLSNYSRSLTGGKWHYEDARISANVFASRDTTRQIIEEFPANGTSGPFRLSRTGGLVNSEKLEVITRDRNQPAIILRSLPLARFSDYEIEPLTGRILLKAPVASLDEQLNPISLRVTYEIDQGGDAFWVAGADAQIKVGDRFEIGAMLVEDRNPLDKFRMAGVNAIARLADRTFLIAEVARTDRERFAAGLSTGERSGSAKRVELRHASGNLEASAFVGRSDIGFDNPNASLSSGRDEAGGRLAYKLDDKTRVKGEFLHTEDAASAAKRDGLLLAIERNLSDSIRIEGGIRHARDSQQTAAANGAPVPKEVTAVRAKVTGEVPGIKDASAYVEAEVDVNDTGRKIAAVGGDYKLGNAGRLYARHEFISSLTGPYGLSSQQRQNATVIGLNTDYMKDGTVFSEYRIRDAISGGDAEAAFGLRNLWTLREGLRANTSFERVHALSGAGNNESSAIALGLEYTANAIWKGSTRLELRDGKTSDSLLSTISGAAKLSRDWTLLARNSYSLTRNEGTSTGDASQERLQVGMAYRDTDTDVWNGVARAEHRSERDDTQPSVQLKRTVDLISVHANWQPRRPFTFSGRYAAKWVDEQTNGVGTRTQSQLLSGRAAWEFAPRWDASLHAATMLTRGVKSRTYAVGVELGFMVMENLWLSGGYNFSGFRDDDLTEGENTSKGMYIRLRYKFDEDLFGGKQNNALSAQTKARSASVAEPAQPKGGH